MYLNAEQYLILGELLEALSRSNARYVLYGTGKVAAEILFFAADGKLQLPAFIVDHQEFADKKFCGVPFLHLDNVTDTDADVVILASNLYTDDMRRHLRSSGKLKKCDIYDLDSRLIKQLKKSDIHHHLRLSAYNMGLEYLNAVYDKIVAEWNIRKVSVFSAGLRSDVEEICNNDIVIKVARQRPDIFIPFASVNLGIDSADIIDSFVAQGFRGVKFICPAAAYDSPEFDDVYRKVAENNLIAIFHTGIYPPHNKIAQDNNTCSEWHRAIYLECVAKRFPSMKIICSHFGAPWIEDVIYLINFFPNVYADFSASLYLGSFSVEYFCWRLKSIQVDVLRRKIVFGSDFFPEDYSCAVDLYDRIFKNLNLDLSSMKRIMNDNYEEIVGG